MSFPVPEKSDNHRLSSYLRSSHLPQVIIALNVLLEASSDHEENHALSSGGEEVVEGLVSAFERCVGWDWEEHGKKPSEECRKRKRKDDSTSCKGGIDELLSNAWVSSGDLSEWDDSKWSLWSEYCHGKLCPLSRSSLVASAVVPLVSAADGKVIECIVMVVRNLSYVAANCRFLGHSVGLVRMLGACLRFRPLRCQHSTASSSSGGDSNPSNPSSSSSSPCSANNACLYSIQALINLSPFLDITGKKLFADLMLLEPQKHGTLVSNTSYGQAHSLGTGGMLIAKRFDLREEQLPITLNTSIQTLCHHHITAILTILPPLTSLIACTTDNNRSIVVSALELLKELLENNNTDNQALFRNVPDSLLSSLVHLLYVPRLGPDSLEYVDPVSNVVSRVSSLKLLNGYDAKIDFELRDRSIELLDKLTALSPDLKRRLGVQNTPKIMDFIMPLFTTKVGRSDAAQLAGRVLANMAMVPENHKGILYIERKLIKLASNDPNVANVACNCLFNQIHY